MKIAKIRIRNILGIDDLEFDAGRFTEISGANGTGKTSVLEAIKAVIKGGEDATLMRRGAEKSEVVLVLDDGTEIKRRMTGKTTTTTVERDGVKASRPGETIKALTDALSVNPIDFLRSPAKTRVNVLLDSLPMTADVIRLSAIVGYDVKVDSKLHALQQIEAVRKAVYDDRTGTNRAAKEKEATINQWAATLPDGEVKAPMATDNLVVRLAEIDVAKDAELDRIAAKLAGLRDERVARLETIRDDREAAIAALQAQIDQLRAAAMGAIEAENTAWTEVERKATQQRERKLAEFAGQRETVASQLAAIEAAQSQRARHAQTRETIRQMREEAEGLQRDATGQTAAIDKLDAYKSELLANLPIPGLEVRDGAILRNEIPFDRLNTAQQIEIAVEIAKLRAGKLAVACVDGIELLDADHYQTFRQQALESGLQLFVTRVSDGEFQVTSDASC